MDDSTNPRARAIAALAEMFLDLAFGPEDFAAIESKAIDLGHGLLILPIDAALLQHLIHQGGLAVVNVGDDGDVSQMFVLQRKSPFLLRLGSRDFSTYSKILYSPFPGISSFSRGFFQKNGIFFGISPFRRPGAGPAPPPGRPFPVDTPRKIG